MAVWTLTYTIQDRKGKTAQHKLYLPLLTPQFIDPTGDPAEFAQEYARALEPLLTGAIVNIGLSLNVDLPEELINVIALGSDVEEGAKFAYQTTNGFIFEHRIPTFNEDLLLPDGTVDLAAVADESPDYIGLMLNATELPADWAFQVTDSRGDDLQILIRAREKFNASSNYK